MLAAGPSTAPPPPELPPEVPVESNTTNGTTAHSDEIVTSSGQRPNTACVFISHSCSAGPYIDAARVTELPLQCGPMSVHRVLRICVQSLLDVATDPKAFMGRLRDGEGRVQVTAVVDGKIVSARLPAIKKANDLWNYLDSLTEDLLCCDNFLSKVPVTSCSQCKKKSASPPGGSNITSVSGT